MNQTDLSSSDTPEESAAGNDAASSVHLPPSRHPRAAPDDGEEKEKDAQDHLTPAAMVRAASGTPLHRIVRNSNDLEKDAPDDDVEQVDKVLASVPPTLERQPAVLSQPGAFRAGGDARPNDDESVLSGNSSAPPAAHGLIEATLVEESAPPPPAVVAPVYKGQIIEEDEDTTTAEHPENVVTLPKRYVHCFIGAFIMLCVITILTVVLLLVLDNKNSGGSNMEPQRDPNKSSSDKNDLINMSQYWHQSLLPDVLRARLENYTYVSHHMAIVSIVNPDVSSIDSTSYSEAMCLPIQDDGATSSRRRFLRDHSWGRNLGFDAPVAVTVTFTCGSKVAPVTTIVNNVLDTMILFHDADVNDVNLGNYSGNYSIICMDVKGKVNEVFCRIPNEIGGVSHFPFLFSCFSQTEEMAMVASVETHNLSVQCSSSPVAGEQVDGAPKIFVKSPAAIVLSTQRLCRLTDDTGFVLENSLLGWRNLTDACTYGMHLSVANVPLCFSQSMQANTSYSLDEQMFCSSGTETCFGRNFSLPSVAVSDPWNVYSNDAAACSASRPVNDSLVVKSTGENSYPSVPLINSSTLHLMEIYLEAQEGWVQDEVLNSSNT